MPIDTVIDKRVFTPSTARQYLERKLARRRTPVKELTEIADRGVSVVAVTHDPTVAEYADRTIELRDGMIV